MSITMTKCTSICHSNFFEAAQQKLLHVIPVPANKGVDPVATLFTFEPSQCHTEPSSEQVNIWSGFCLWNFTSHTARKAEKVNQIFGN